MENKQSNKLMVAIFFGIAILLGISIQYVNVVLSLLLIFIWLLCVLISLGIIIIGIFRKKFRVLYLVGFFPIIVGYTYMTVIREYKKSKAESIITQLEEFKKRNGDYPIELVKLEKDIVIDGLTYETDSALQEFRLEYLMDNVNRQYYNSKSRKWGTLGWND